MKQPTIYHHGLSKFDDFIFFDWDWILGVVAITLKYPFVAVGRIGKVSSTAQPNSENLLFDWFYADFSLCCVLKCKPWCKQFQFFFRRGKKNNKQTRKTRCELWKKPWKKYWTVICISKNKQFQKIIHMNIMGVPLSLCSKHAKSLYNLKCFFTITFFSLWTAHAFLQLIINILADISSNISTFITF